MTGGRTRRVARRAWRALRVGRRALSRTFVAGLALAASLAVPRQALAGCQLAAMDLPVTMVRGRPITTVGINGQAVPMLVDSGAFMSMLTDAAAAELGLSVRMTSARINGYTGDFRPGITSVARLKLPVGELHNIEFLVGGNEVLDGVKGIVGRNLLAAADTEYDLANGVVRLFFPKGDCRHANLAYWVHDGTPVNIVPLDDSPTWGNGLAIWVTAKVNGHPVEALLDTGASTVLHLNAAHAAGIRDKDLTAAGRMTGVGRGHASRWTAEVDSFELGDERITHNHMDVSNANNTEDDMLLGVDYFLSHRIYVARSQGRLYATWNGGRVFALNRAASSPAPAASGAGDDAATKPADLARRGEASAARGDLGAAIADLDRAVSLAPQDGPLRVARARVELSMKRVEVALADLDAALQQDASLADARQLRAWVRLYRHDEAGALADLQALDARLAPGDGRRDDMARLLMRLDRPAEALHQWALWQPTHDDEANIDGVRDGRCWARVLLDTELDQAQDDCDAAVKDDPSRASYQESLGWVLLRRGHAREAVAAFDKSLALWPKGAWSLYGRGIAHQRLGEAAAAQADLAAARKLDDQIDVEARKHGMQAG